VSVFAQGGLQLRSLAGAPSFPHLARLAPDGGPGSWSVAWFLPAAALLGFTLLEGNGWLAAWRYAMVAVAGLYLAWLSAAGYLPGPLTNAPAYLAVTALAYCTLATRGLASMIGFERRAFGYRHLAVGGAGILLAAGLVLQAGLAGVANWHIGRDNLPPAWPLVARADKDLSFRVLWLSRRVGAPLPAPGGDPQHVLTAAGTTLRYALAGRGGASALDTGRAEHGDGYGYLDGVLAETLSGTTVNAGALLGPLSVRYVVADKGDLPPSVLSRLDAQVDLDLIPAGGLVIYRNERFLPSAWASSDPAYVRAARDGSLLDVASLPTASIQPLERTSHGITGDLGAGSQPSEAVMGQQFDGGWRLHVVSVTEGTNAVTPHRAFGWATGFGVPARADGVLIDYGRQWIRTIEMWVLGLLWVIALWLTRKPARIKRSHRRTPSPSVGRPAEVPV